MAIKIHAESEAQRKGTAMAGLYDKEIFFFLHLREKMPVRAPTPLAIWTDGSDGTDRTKPIEFFALMMEDLSPDREVFDAVCLDPARTMTVEEKITLVKLQARIHDKYWASKEAESYPLA